MLNKIEQDLLLLEDSEIDNYINHLLEINSNLYL